VIACGLPAANIIKLNMFNFHIENKHFPTAACAHLSRRY
jgi:hypothetical protein